jgi:hypothetical protein
MTDYNGQCRRGFSLDVAGNWRALCRVLPTSDGVFSGNDGDFDITAGGADVWGNADQFRFTYQPKTGDFDVKVMIGNQTIPNSILKAGLLARESLDPASRTLHAIVNPPFPGLDRYETGQRITYAGTTAGWGSGFNNGNRFATPPNSWVRLQRVNNTFTAYAGSTGTDWVRDWTHHTALPTDHSRRFGNGFPCSGSRGNE